MEIDIRSGCEDEVKGIRFSDTDVITDVIYDDRRYVEFNDSDGNVYPVLIDDIDNLIKALEHAKKIWSLI